jgi:predicted nucleic acid-binding protein
MGAAAVLEQPQPRRPGRLTGRLRPDQQQWRGRPTLGRDVRHRETARPLHPINDTWIAACCLAEGLPLATLNVKDYTDVATYHGLTLITT